MIVNREKLIMALQMVRPGLARKELIEQSDSFVFTKGNVHSYNDELSVSFPVDFHVEGAVRAKEFFDLLNKTKEDELDIEAVEGGLTVKGRKYNATIKFQPDIVLPIFFGDDETYDWKDLPADFSIGVASCLFSVGKDMSEPVLTCIHVTGNTVESCDRFRLTRYIMSPSGDAPTQDANITDDLLIPATAARELSKYDPIQYAIAAGWIHFSSAVGTLFSCRTYSQLKFPDLTKNLEIVGGVVKFPEDMSDMLTRASIFAGDSLSGTPTVSVTIGDGKIIVRGVQDSGSFEEWSRIRYEGPPLSFHINPAFLFSILNSKCDAVAAETRLKFQNANFTHVVCTILGSSK